MTLKDLAAYRADWVRAAVPPVPQLLGVRAAAALERRRRCCRCSSMLDHTDIASRGPNDPQAWFLFAQASRLMYADRDRYVGDPHFVPVPVEKLLDPAYVRAARAADRRARGSRRRSRASSPCRAATMRPPSRPARATSS